MDRISDGTPLGGWVDKLAPVYAHALTLRLRMPISDDLNPRNFVTKITAYAHVIDVPNSVTVLRLKLQ